jgi:cytochrome bd-type quinol oxidase subunit 2
MANLNYMMPMSVNMPHWPVLRYSDFWAARWGTCRAGRAHGHRCRTARDIDGLDRLTVGDAAVPEKTLSFLFFGVGFSDLLVVAIYTGLVYWLFRGKAARATEQDAWEKLHGYIGGDWFRTLTHVSP